MADLGIPQQGGILNFVVMKVYQDHSAPCYSVLTFHLHSLFSALNARSSRMCKVPTFGLGRWFVSSLLWMSFTRAHNLDRSNPTTVTQSPGEPLGSLCTHLARNMPSSRTCSSWGYCSRSRRGICTRNTPPWASSISSRPFSLVSLSIPPKCAV